MAHDQPAAACQSFPSAFPVVGVPEPCRRAWRRPAHRALAVGPGHLGIGLPALLPADRARPPACRVGRPATGRRAGRARPDLWGGGHRPHRRAGLVRGSHRPHPAFPALDGHGVRPRLYPRPALWPLWPHRQYRPEVEHGCQLRRDGSVVGPRPADCHGSGVAAGQDRRRHPAGNTGRGAGVGRVGVPGAGG